MAVMSLSVNIQRLPGSRGKSDAILGKEIKREGGGVGGWGSVSIILTFLENFQNTRGLLVYPIYSATKYCVNIS